MLLSSSGVDPHIFLGSGSTVWSRIRIRFISMFTVPNYYAKNYLNKKLFTGLPVRFIPYFANTVVGRYLPTVVRFRIPKPTYLLKEIGITIFLTCDMTEG